MSDANPSYTDHFTENDAGNPRKRRRPWQSAHRPAYIAAVELRAGPARQSIVPPPSDAAQRDQFASFTRRESSTGIGLDCPIRAGPNGHELCGWRPDDGTNGFPNLTRVRDHVSRHGMLCPDCGRTFQRHRHFKEHLKRRPCNDMYAFEGQSRYPLRQLPEEIDDFFESFNQKGPSVSPADAWMRAYKCLHPYWEFDNHPLPSASYRQNADREKTMLSQPGPQVLVTPSQDAVAGAIGDSRPFKQAPAPGSSHLPGPVSQKQSEDSMAIRAVDSNGKAPMPILQRQAQLQDGMSPPAQTNLDFMTGDTLQEPDTDWENFLNGDGLSLEMLDVFDSDQANLPHDSSALPSSSQQPGTTAVGNSVTPTDWLGVKQKPARSTVDLEPKHSEPQPGILVEQRSTSARPAAPETSASMDPQHPSSITNNSQHLTSGLQNSEGSQSLSHEPEVQSSPLPSTQNDPHVQDTTMTDIPITSTTTNESTRSAIVDYFSAEIDTLTTQLGTLRMHGQAIQSHTKNCHRDLIVHPETHHDMTRKRYVDVMVQMFSEARFQLF